MAQLAQEIRENYPLPSYNFRVSILVPGGEALALGFSEVSGLKLEYETVNYKHGLSFLTGQNFLPGAPKPVVVILKRGITRHGSELLEWIELSTRLPYIPVHKRDVLVDLCDEQGEAVVRWTVKSAFPSKLEAGTFSAAGNEVAVDTLELSAAGLRVSYLRA